MEEMEIYTDEQWAKDGTFNAKPGQFVEDKVVYQLRDCVPPLSFSRDYIQVGEAHGTCPVTFRNTYATFAKEDGRWKFVGNVPHNEGRPRLKTFADLKFKSHPTIRLFGHLQATMDFPNGYGVSVVIGKSFYSNGDDTFEVAVTKGGELCYTTPVASDVIGHRTKDEVTEIMARIQRL